MSAAGSPLLGATARYESATGSASLRTSAARASISSAASAASWSSQTDSVPSAADLLRAPPPRSAEADLSRELRWRRTRSRSLRTASNRGARLTSSSSRKRASLAGVPLDQGQVLRGEEHPGHLTQDIALARHGRPVESGPVGTPRRDLELDDDLTATAFGVDPDHRPFGSLAAPGGRRWPPGASAGRRRTRSPRSGWSCPARWPRRTSSPRPRGRALPTR